MALTYTGTGGLFTRLGSLGAIYRNINGFRGAVATDVTAKWGASGPLVKDAKTSWDNLEAQFQSTLQQVFDGFYSTQTSLRTAQDPIMSSIASFAATLLISQVNADTPLQALDVPHAMAELIRQMKATADSVKAATVSATPAAGSTNIGTPTVIASVKNSAGINSEYINPEVIQLKVTSGVLQGATLGNEPYSITGALPDTSVHNYTWPLGSGASNSGNIVDPTVSNGSGNILTNSDFNLFTVANTPDNWPILIGTPGTSILKQSGTTYRGSNNALEFVCDGAELTSIAQTFNTGAGTLGTISPSTVYAFQGWLYAPATIAAGVLAVELIDGSGNIIADDAAVASTIATTLSGLSATTWTSMSGFMRTPTNLASTVKLRIRLSTAGTNTKHLYIDECALTPAVLCYTGGPYVAAFRSIVDAILGDLWNVTIANNFGVSSVAIFQNLFQRWFDMRSLGLALPSSGSPTIADSLVV